MKAIFLDVDGTLINTMPIFDRIVHEEVARRGKEITDEDLNRIGQELYSTFATANISGGRRMAFKLFYYLGRVIGFGRLASLSFMLSCVLRVRKVYRTAPLFDDVLPSIESLKKTNLPLGLVTMASERDLHKTPKLKPILDKFDVIITRDDVKKIKPDPEACFLAAEKLDVPPEDCYIVGDLPFDIQAGKEAKMTTVAVTTGLATSEYLEYSKPHKMCNSLTEATNWIIHRFEEENGIKINV